MGRSRPELDPDPQIIRSKFNSYSSSLPKVMAGKAVDYSLRQSNGSVSVANDAEISLIAAHATRFAWDILLGTNPSIFLESMFLIGLSKGWVFEGPFDTIPLDMGKREESAPAVVSSEVKTENSKFIEFLLSEHANATAAAA